MKTAWKKRLEMVLPDGVRRPRHWLIAQETMTIR